MDVAALNLEINSSSVVTAADNLDRFADSSKRAGMSSGSISRIAQDYARSAEKINQFSNSAARAAEAAQRSARFATYGAAAIKEVGNTSRVAAHHAQNLYFQLNDVFMGLTTGQDPMTVFIQQGAQIGQIYGQTGLTVKGFALAIANMTGIIRTTTAAQEAAALAAANQMEASVAAANAQAAANVRAAETNIMISRTQVSMATTATEATLANARLAASTEALAAAQAEAAITAQALAAAQKETAAASEAAAAVTRTSLGVTSVAIAGTLAVVIPLTAGIAALTAQANNDSGLKKYTKSMGYTREEVEKLNAVTVTYGDTMRAVFQVAWERIASAFGISTDNLSKKWNEFLDFMLSATRATFAGLYAAFTGGFYALNQAIESAQKGEVANPFDTIAKGYKSAYDDAQKFMDDVVSQAGANARARQDALAASFYDKPSTRAGKSEAEKQAERWADILKSADQQQRAIEQAGDRIGKYGIDLDQITNVQNLFNKAQDAGIEITKRGTIALNEQGLELQRRAIRMADAANDNRIAEFNESLTKSFEQQMMALRSEAAELGLTGAALAAYRYEQEALNAAKAVGLAQDSEAIQRIREQGAEYAAQVDAVEKARKAIEDQRRAMEASREIVSGFFLDWINGVREGENVFRAFEKSVIRALNNIIDKLIQAAIEQMLFNSIAGSGGATGI